MKRGAVERCTKCGEPVLMMATLQEAKAELTPIDTAPKDGTALLGFFPDRQGHLPRRDVRVVYWSQGWMAEGMPCSAPSHWMPVPRGVKAVPPGK